MARIIKVVKLRRKKIIAVLSLLAAICIIQSGAPVVYALSDNGTVTPIKHLIILMMENHSFDNLFGIYGQSINGTIEQNVTIPTNILNLNGSARLTEVSSGLFNTTNPTEGYSNYHADWNNGKMNGFLNGSGPSSLTYFSSSQAALEWDLAMNFALGDMYFSSVLSETLPNRLYSLAGFSPVMEDQASPPPSIMYNQTVFGEMDHYGVTWKYYLKSQSGGNEPLNFISGIGNHYSNVATWQNFMSSIQNGSLPSVSWISPISGGASGYSQHPSDNILAGEMWLFKIVYTLMHSNLWSSSAVIITYDEGGGYYDQVSPPIVEGEQLGFRVPFLLISPYAKEDYVSSTIMSHSSILAFIDYNWKMPALNRMVAVSNIPLDMFNFNKSYPGSFLARSPPVFDSKVMNLLPKGLESSVTYSNNFNNISNCFPANLQYRVSGLPYSTSGSSNTTLQNSSSSLYVGKDIPITSGGPPERLIILIGLTIVVASAATYLWRRSRKS